MLIEWELLMLTGLVVFFALLWAFGVFDFKDEHSQ